MDTCMHKTMVSVASLEKIEIIRSQEFMPSEERLKFLKKMIILGPKTAILGLNFDLCPLPETLVSICMLLVLFLGPVLSFSNVINGNLSKMFEHSSSNSKS